MNLVLLGWPYVGLGLATVLLAWLLLAPRKPGAASRWNDPMWVLRLVWPMYLLHMFEEHGIDALGRHFAFLGDMCAALGFPTPEGCPADAGFIFAVNPVELWFAFGLAFALTRERPLMAACAWGVPLVNAVAHIGSAVMHEAYNPGLVTSLVLFLPLGGWMLRTVVVSKVVSKAQIPRIIATGALLHAVLLASLLLRERGLPYAVMLGLNVAAGSLPLALGTLRAPERVTGT